MYRRDAMIRPPHSAEEDRIASARAGMRALMDESKGSDACPPIIGTGAMPMATGRIDWFPDTTILIRAASEGSRDPFRQKTAHGLYGSVRAVDPFLEP